MPKPHIIFDIETVLDHDAYARAHDLPIGDVDAVRAELGDDFPKPLFHKIVAIAAVVLTYDIPERNWRILEMASLHAGNLTERELIEEFVHLMRCTIPILVSYNGASFDLPVIRNRALLHRISAGELARIGAKPWSGDHVDLCDALGARGRDRMTLDEAARALNVGSKTEGMDGSKVEALAAQGEYETIAAYCLDDVAATAAIFLARETYSGRLDRADFEKCREDLRDAVERTKRLRPQHFVQTPEPVGVV